MTRNHGDVVLHLPHTLPSKNKPFRLILTSCQAFFHRNLLNFSGIKMPHFIMVFQASNSFAPYHLLLGLSILFSSCSLVTLINKNFFILHILYLLYYFYFLCFRHRFELSFFIYFGSGPYSRSMPVFVTSHILPAFRASLSKNLGFPPLYPVQACCMDLGFIPHFPAASAAVITSSSGFISSPP